MAITIRERRDAAPALIQAFTIDPALLERPEAQAARQRGLLRAKTEALRATENLISWARPLLVGVLIVAFCTCSTAEDRPRTGRRCAAPQDCESCIRNYSSARTYCCKSAATTRWVPSSA